MNLFRKSIIQIFKNVVHIIQQFIVSYSSKVEKIQNDQKLFCFDSSSNSFKEIQRREEMLQPLYTQVACEYADLHDRAGRMKAVGAVRESLSEKSLLQRSQ